jgi:hypothetical protein
MSHSEPPQIAARGIRPTVLAAFVCVGAMLIGVGQLVGPSLASLPGTGGRGLTVFDEDSPAVTNLDPDLRRALRRAARDAARYRVEIVINSGWRSPKYQERLLRQAVWKYGSEEKAARWVASADTSSHVSGHAVDIGPSRATAWLSKHGAKYGLCRIYRNEPWHYELRPEATDNGCPSMYADPSRLERRKPTN